MRDVGFLKISRYRHFHYLWGGGRAPKRRVVRSPPHSELSMYSHNIPVLRLFKRKLLLRLLFSAFPMSSRPQMGQKSMNSFIKILWIFGFGARFQVILRRTFLSFCWWKDPKNSSPGCHGDCTSCEPVLTAWWWRLIAFVRMRFEVSALAIITTLNNLENSAYQRRYGSSHR